MTNIFHWLVGLLRQRLWIAGDGFCSFFMEDLGEDKRYVFISDKKGNKSFVIISRL
jgi:hypothetical protein